VPSTGMGGLWQSFLRSPSSFPGASLRFAHRASRLGTGAEPRSLGLVRGGGQGAGRVVGRVVGRVQAGYRQGGGQHGGQGTRRVVGRVAGSMVGRAQAGCRHGGGQGAGRVQVPGRGLGVLQR